MFLSTKAKSGAEESRIKNDCLVSLPRCSTEQAKRLLNKGGEISFLLDEDSSLARPAWRVVLNDVEDQIWVLASGKSGQPRLLGSPQRVYQIARILGLSDLKLPVDYK